MNKRRRGFSLVEVMMTTAVMGMVIAGGAALTINMIRSYNWTSAQFDSDRSAAQAVQAVSRDLQEAKQVTVQSATSIRVYYPAVAGDGSYIQNILDTTNYLDFYRGNSNGTANATGDYFIRKTATGTARVLCRKVTNVTFSSTTPNSCRITLATSNSRGTANTTCQIVQRSIFLRNY